MTGKDCVGICSDSRLGNQAQTVATDFEKIFKMGDQLMASVLALFSSQAIWSMLETVLYRTDRPASSFFQLDQVGKLEPALSEKIQFYPMTYLDKGPYQRNPPKQGTLK